MNVYVLYDVVSMFVNDVVCDRDKVSLEKELPVLRLLGCALFGDSRRYPDSTDTLDSHRWVLLDIIVILSYFLICHIRKT